MSYCSRNSHTRWVLPLVGLVLLPAAVVLGAISDEKDDAGFHQSLLRYNGEVNIGVLVNLHHPPDPTESGGDDCGLINVDAMQQVIAAKWAVDVINNQSLPHELNIGLQLHDTCTEEDLTQEHLYHVISSTREELDKARPPLLGMIGIGDPATLASTSGALRAFNIPLISASPEHAENLGREDNVLTTAPDMSGQARAVASLAYDLDVQSLSLISSSHKIIQTFLSEATTMGIRVPRILELSHRQRDQPQQVEGFLRHMTGSNPTVVLIVNSHEAVAIAEHLKHTRLNSRPTWLIGSLGLDLKKLSGWRRVFHGGIFVEPHMPELQEFKKYFISSLQDPGHNLRELIKEYKEEMFGCTHNPQAVASSFLMPCDKIPAHEIELRFQQDPHVSFVVKAVSALTAAFRLVQLDHCTANIESSCLRKVHEDLHEDILGNLRKLSFSSMMPQGSAANEVDGTQHHFTRNGRLVANKQQVYIIDRNDGLEQIGWYSEDEGLHLATSLSDLLATTELPVSSPLINQESLRGRSTFARSIDDTYAPKDSAVLVKSPSSLETLPIFSYESFISRTWALVVVSVAIFGFFVSLWMLIYVFQKMCDGTLPGNQLMGVFLLMGVMCLFASVVPWLLPPNETICALRHFIHPLLLVFCFSILLVKSMQLRSLVTIGLGGSIPQVNQLMSLFFMVMVQVVIAVEWYLATRPVGIQITDGYPECGVSRSRFLLLHLYPTALLLLTFFYGVSVLKVKRNFNEGRWITCATIFIIPIFAAWPVVYYFAPVPFHDPSVSVSVLAVAGILLAAIFLPKMNTIAQQSRMKQTDLSRTHSDATVYTGFSDYVPFAGKPPSKQPVYPVYGYTTNQFVPQHSSSPRKTSSSSSKRQHQHPKNVRPENDRGYNASNYFSSPSTPPVKSYADWSREYSPGAYNVNHHHHHQYRNVPPQQHHFHHDEPAAASASQAQVVYSVSRSNESSTNNLQPPMIIDDQILNSSQDSSSSSRRRRRRKSSRLEEDEETKKESRRHSHTSSTAPRFLDYGHDIEDEDDEIIVKEKALPERQRHSHSPSDGMILTAEGLTDSNHQHPGFRVSEVFLTH